MGYSVKTWRSRIAERSDLSTQLIHLTRSSEEDSRKVLATTNLQNILKDKKIRGSTNKGFIIGSKSAACFQDAPLYAACQNIYFEQKYRKANRNAKVRYNAIGIMFPKEYVYAKGGRPVFYEKTDLAKKILPKDEWWRIVNFDLSDEDNIIDWTHEREWRCPGDFEFELGKTTLLFVKSLDYQSFYKWDMNQKETLLDKIKGIVVASDIFY